ncbi:PLP-dependent aminotransferase family protein [uncultured Pseudomonas sp.]|uniref:aminotransferase-like domain-containing protein n=1 Tax=uncultured Pseudomonas sp. TaxID=114707 RepID=UPI0025DB8B7F|nr:PLP-dependent aminotransferase family protein [uncultured Pseudomonas sp.]
MQIQRAAIASIAYLAGEPRGRQIVEHITACITDGRLAPGVRLPPIRELSGLLQVSKSTVVEALDRLRAAGLLTARQGAGYYVARDALASARPEPVTSTAPAPDILATLRQALMLDNGTRRPGCGFLPAAWLPDQELMKAMRGTLRASALRMGEYGAVPGYLPLRQTLRHKLAALGIQAGTGQIVTTASTVQAVDMLLQLLLQPGDTALLDEPGYVNFRAALTLRGARVVSVPRSREGLDFAALERLLGSERPRVYLTNSTLHNPTGHSFSVLQAQRLLELCQRFAVQVIEDDIYCDLQPDAPRLAALGGLARVSYVSGFSKTLSANCRVSYAVVEAQLAERLQALKLTSGAVTSELTEQVIQRMLLEGSYERHTRRLVDRLYESGARVSRWLAEAGCTLHSTPGQGLFIWARLPSGQEAVALARRGLALGLVLAPGALLSQAPDACHFMRFNVGHSDSQVVRDAFLRLLEGR